MRMLIWHVDRFKCAITERGRSPLIEEGSSSETEVEEALLVLASVEKADEAAPERVAERAVAERAAAELLELAERLGAHRVVLHPFAHLFGELSRPATAVQVLDRIKQVLGEQGVEAMRTPFGWFNRLEIEAKGHKLSRLARRIPFGKRTVFRCRLRNRMGEVTRTRGTSVKSMISAVLVARSSSCAPPTMSTRSRPGRSVEVPS